MRDLRQINLNRLLDFHSIVQNGSISKAANSLGEAKTRLSRNLALFEKELGVQLFYRTTRQIQLSPAGQQLYRDTLKVVGDLESAISSLSGPDQTAKGRLRITAPEDFGNVILTPILAEFRKAYPLVRFELIYTNTVLDLVALGIDVAFRMGPNKDSSMVQRALSHTSMILAASPEFIDRHGTPKTPEDLSRLPCVGFGKSPSGSWPFVSGKSKLTVKVNFEATANNFITVRDLTLAGFGIAYLPRFLCDAEIQSGRLIHCLKTHSNEYHPVSLLTPASKQKNPLLKAFSEFVVHKLTQVI